MLTNKLKLIKHFQYKKARGTSKAVTKKTLSFDHYKKCLFNNETVRSIQHRIKSTPYSVDTVEINKIALKVVIIRD